MSLDDLVNVYAAKGMISEEDRVIFAQEFGNKYLRIFGEIEDRLLDDLRELATPLIDGYRGMVPIFFISNAVRDPFNGTVTFSGLLPEMREEYVGLRIDGKPEEEAFGVAVQPLVDLMEHVRHRNIAGHLFYYRIKAYLDQASANPSGLIKPQPAPQYQEAPIQRVPVALATD